MAPNTKSLVRRRQQLRGNANWHEMQIKAKIEPFKQKREEKGCFEREREALIIINLLKSFSFWSVNNEAFEALMKAFEAFEALMKASLLLSEALITSA